MICYQLKNIADCISKWLQVRQCISWACKILMRLLPSIYLNLTPSVMWWCQWWQGPEPGRVWRAGRGRDHRQWCAGARSVLAEVPTTASRDPRTRAATFAAKMWLHWSLVSRARRCVNRTATKFRESFHWRRPLLEHSPSWGLWDFVLWVRFGLLHHFD